MKKLTAIFAAAALALSMAGTVMAQGSIGQPTVPERPKVEGVPNGYSAKVKEVDKEMISKIKSEAPDVAELYEALTDGKSFAKELTTVLASDLDSNGEYTMSNDVKVNPANLIQLSTPVEFSIENDDGVMYTPDGDIEMSMVVEAAKDLGEDVTAENLVIVLTDPESGETVLVPVDSYDPATGEISAKLPFPGIITLMLNPDTAETETETETEA